MRQFYLENEIGQTFWLNNVTNGFLQKPNGLGYSIDASYTKIGTAWKRNSFKDTQAKISAEIVFGTDSPYETMQELLKYVRKSSELVLHRVTAAGEYLKDVDLLSMEIGEIEDGDFLTVPVEFIAKSLWYKPVNSVYQATPVTTGAQRYPQVYPARYFDYTIGNIEIENDGSVPAPMLIVMNGAVVNPAIKLKVDGEEVFRVEITGQASSGERIEWSSRDGKLFCEKVSALGVRTNLVGGFDIDNANFFKAPVGNCALEFTADAALTSPVTVTLYKQYRAV